MARSRNARKKAKVGAKPSKAVPSKPALPKHLVRYVTSINLPDLRQQPRLLSLLFCDYVSRTDDKKVNLLGIFDRVFMHPEEKQAPVFFVFARVAEAYEEPLYLRVFSPDNEPQAELKFDPPVMLTEPNMPKQIQVILKLQIGFKKTGTYWFDLSYQGNSIGGAGLVVGHKEVGRDVITDTFE